ncbi:SlyX family protein [uncultured Endozoicomonas sp.]|nr:SlyX family protein [uncultured Endozoicomonas sp.]
MDLQTQLSFQEDTIAQLNEVVTRQQKDITRLTEAFSQLKKQFEVMAAEQQEGGNHEEAPPPHY